MLELNKVYNMDCIDGMKQIEDNSIDSIITDPPYELGFMGKSWDNTGIANNVELWKEAYRILKPGGYLLSFGGTRTYHRMASAIEDAGFEIRDMIEWVYGSGFPKSLNIGKALDKKLGNEREIIGRNPNSRENCDKTNTIYESGTVGKTDYLTKGTSEWEGWGTALKPAHEPIVVARKPLSERTVVENCLKFGTGGINIDDSRVNLNGDKKVGGFGNAPIGFGGGDGKNAEWKENTQGRFPANFIHDGSPEVLKEFEKAGNCGDVSDKSKYTGKIYGKENGGSWFTGNINLSTRGKEELGTPARFFKQCEFTEEDFEYAPFFYCAKASKGERNKGCEGLEEKETPITNQSWKCKLCGKFQLQGNGDICKCENPEWIKPSSKNVHPTVKPIKLMEYLVKLVTRKDGIVLDPFIGSGTTAVACAKLNRKFIGFEKEKEYIEIINARLKPYIEQTKLFKVE